MRRKERARLVARTLLIRDFGWDKVTAERLGGAAIEAIAQALLAFGESCHALVKDLAAHGTRHDLTPTLVRIDWKRGVDENVTALDAAYCTYLAGLDETIRKRAREALEGK